MNELKKTMTFGGVSLALALLALVSAPRRSTPDAFLDKGEVFFPDFTDPNVATTLEVIEFDESTAAAKPFKVTNQDGIWTIPSHNNYPADGKDRLAQTAAGIIDIRKDDFRSDNVADHEACGVLDPLDEGITGLQGRGKRVTIKGTNDLLLADFIIGNEIEDRTGFRFVRIPSQKRVYAARIDVDISTRFEDWIEKDLLLVERSRIDHVILKDYSINERTLRIVERGDVVLNKEDALWTTPGMSASEEVSTTDMNTFLTAIDDLNIVGVRPKPAGISATLQRVQEGAGISRADMMSLQSKGFYLTQDGSLVSNEGELQVSTEDGITYTLRFGEILYGSGDAITAGGEGNDDESSGPGENRYLFITAEFRPERIPEPPRPNNTDFEAKDEADLTDEDKANKAMHDDHSAWEEKIKKGEEEATRLNDRFSDWYYVISAESFDKVNLERSDLIKQKES